MKRIILNNVTDMTEFMANIFVPAYAEVHEAANIYDDNAVIVPEGKAKEMLDMLRKHRVQCFIENTYQIFETGQDFSNSIATFGSNNLDVIKDWLDDSEEGEYVVFKDREPYNFD